LGPSDSSLTLLNSFEKVWFDYNAIRLG
jgi:hypothetical protein